MWQLRNQWFWEGYGILKSLLHFSVIFLFKIFFLFFFCSCYDFSNARRTARLVINVPLGSGRRCISSSSFTYYIAERQTPAPTLARNLCILPASNRETDTTSAPADPLHHSPLCQEKNKKKNVAPYSSQHVHNPLLTSVLADVKIEN
jgi:hypothetical protein